MRQVVCNLRGRGAAIHRPQFKMSATRYKHSNGQLSVRRAEVSHRRTGVLAVKAGMLSTWDQFGNRVALTVLHVDGCRVVQVKEKDKEGYTALQLGAGSRKQKHLNRPKIGHFQRWWNPIDAADFDVEEPYTLLRRLEEFRVSPDALLPVGTSLRAAHFVPGQHVDVQGVTRGKGFQGPMKRWGFAGGPASHGNSRAHRTHGSLGGTQDPGRIFKGKKMAGHMGCKRRTIQNLVVHRVDTQRDLVYVRGAVPGAKGHWVRITDAIKKRQEKRTQPAALGGNLPYPTINAGTHAELPPVISFDDEDPPRRDSN